MEKEAVASTSAAPLTEQVCSVNVVKKNMLHSRWHWAVGRFPEASGDLQRSAYYDFLSFTELNYVDCVTECLARLYKLYISRWLQLCR